MPPSAETRPDPDWALRVLYDAETDDLQEPSAEEVEAEETLAAEYFVEYRAEVADGPTTLPLRVRLALVAADWFANRQATAGIKPFLAKLAETAQGYDQLAAVAAQRCPAGQNVDPAVIEAAFRRMIARESATWDTILTPIAERDDEALAIALLLATIFRPMGVWITMVRHDEAVRFGISGTLVFHLPGRYPARRELPADVQTNMLDLYVRLPEALRRIGAQRLIVEP